MNEFKKYQNIKYKEIRPYIAGESLKGVSIGQGLDPAKDMGYIARDPKNHKDQWYITKKFFNENFREMPEVAESGLKELTKGDVFDELEKIIAKIENLENPVDINVAICFEKKFKDGIRFFMNGNWKWASSVESLFQYVVMGRLDELVKNG